VCSFGTPSGSVLIPVTFSIDLPLRVARPAAPRDQSLDCVDLARPLLTWRAVEWFPGRRSIAPPCECALTAGIADEPCAHARRATVRRASIKKASIVAARAKCAIGLCTYLLYSAENQWSPFVPARDHRRDECVRSAPHASSATDVSLGVNARARDVGLPHTRNQAHQQCRVQLRCASGAALLALRLATKSCVSATRATGEARTATRG